MERKKINSIVVLLLIGILLPVSLFRFSIYAESVAGGSPIIGVNIKYRDYDVDHEAYQLSANLEMPNRWQCVSSHSTMGCQAWISQDTSGTIQDEITGYINVANGSYTDALYEYEFVLDKSYVGYIDFSSAIGVTAYNRYYVNGTSFILTSTQLITSFTVSRYNLEYAPLEVIDMTRQWNVPIESFAYVTYFVNQFPFNNTGTNYFNYPLFDISTGDEMIVGARSNTIGQKFVCIFGINKNIYNASALANYVTYNNVSLVEFKDVNRMDSPWDNQFTIVKLILNNESSDTSIYRSVTFKQNAVIMPIYCNFIAFNSLSTDFALQYGLSNQLLDDLHLIAQGTQQSQTSSGSLDQTTSQFSSDASDLVTIEETFNNSMNQSLQNVNPTFNMGSSFLASANWVSTQFNRIVNNTPFASLITFGLTLGLGLLIIGKVRK